MHLYRLCVLLSLISPLMSYQAFQSTLNNQCVLIDGLWVEWCRWHGLAWLISILLLCKIVLVHVQLNYSKQTTSHCPPLSLCPLHMAMMPDIGQAPPPLCSGIWAGALSTQTPETCLRFLAVQLPSWSCSEAWTMGHWLIFIESWFQFGWTTPLWSSSFAKRWLTEPPRSKIWSEESHSCYSQFL